MARIIQTASAQMGPIAKSETRKDTVRRLIALMREAKGTRRRAGRVHRAGADDLLPALADRGRGRARQLLRARDAGPGNAAAVRRGKEARHRLLSRLRRTGRGRRPQAPLQHLDPGRRIRQHHRQVPQGASARPCRAAAGPHPPASGEALFRTGQLRLQGLARLRRRHGHVHLQRPPLARDLSRHGPSGRRDGHAWLQHALTITPAIATSTA